MARTLTKNIVCYNPMKLRKLPDYVRKLPTVEARQKAMQRAINESLHKQNICPIGQHMAGITAFRVGVFRDPELRYWYVSAAFDEDRAKFFERIALAAIESMTFVKSED